MMDGETPVLDSEGTDSDSPDSDTGDSRQQSTEAPRQQALMRLRGWIHDRIDPEPESSRRSGTPCSLLLVSGDSGVGKTRLIEEALVSEEALAFEQTVPFDEGSQQQPKILCRRVHCHERQGIPFLPVLRLVKDLIYEHGENKGLWQRYAHVLSRVFPELQAELAGLKPQVPLQGKSGRIQFQQALTGILGELSRDRTLILVLHDLHRSDPGTIEFVEYLARNAALSSEPGHNQAGIEGAKGAQDWKHIRAREGRSGEFASSIIEDDLGTPQAPENHGHLLIIADHPLDSSQVDDSELGSLHRQPFSRTIELPILTPSEVTAVVEQQIGSEPSESLTEMITEACGGNPLLVLEMCRLLQEEGGAASPLDMESVQALLEGAQGGSLSRIMIDRRLAALPALERRLLEHLALLRRPVQSSLLVSASGVSQDRLEEALGGLIERGFIRKQVARGTTRYHVSHEIHMHGIRSAIRPEAARNLQQELGRILAQDPRSLNPVRAFEVHELLAAGGDPDRAIEYGIIAMRFFAGAYAEPLAIRIGRRMLDSCGAEGDAPIRREILSLLAKLEVETGQPESGKLHIKMLLEDPDLDPRERLDARCFLGEIYLGLQESLKGIRSLNRISSSDLEAVGSLAEVRLTALRARLRLQRRDIKRAMSLCLRAQKEIDSIADGKSQPEARELLSQVLEILAETHLARGDSVAALNSYQTLLELVERSGDTVRLGSVLRTIGRVYYDRGKQFRAARYLFRALEVVESSQDVRALAATYELLGKVYRNSGDFSRSLEHFRRCLNLRERIGDLHEISPTLNSIGSLHAHSGNYARAVRFFKRSITNSEMFASTRGIVRSFLHLGWTWFALGERKQVENLSRQILILTQEFGLPEYQSEGHRMQGNLALLRGDWKNADRELKKSLEIAQKRGLDRIVAACHFDQAQLALEREQFEESLKFVSRGLLKAEALQSVPLIVQGLLIKGAISRQRSDEGLEKALECYEKALQMITSDSLLPLQWQINYAIARVHQGYHDLQTARDHYDRAAAIIERIASRLPEDMRVVYLDDRRRKNFFTDLQRFKRETAGPPIAVASPATMAGTTNESLRGTFSGISPDAERLAQLIRAMEALGTRTELHSFLEGVLEEARRIVPSPRGFIAAQRNRRWQSLADIDMGPPEDWLVPDQLLGALAQECIERGEALRSGQEGWDQWADSHPQGQTVRGRSLMAIPFEYPGRLSAALVLERPTAGNPFLESDVEEVRRLLTLSRGQLRALTLNAQLLEYEESVIGSLAALEADLDVLLDRHHRDKEPLGFLEVSLPGLDILLGEREDEQFVMQLLNLMEPNFGVYHTGGDHLVCALIGPGEEDLRRKSRDLQHTLQDLREAFGLPVDVPVNILPHWFPVGSSEIAELSSSRIDLFRCGNKPDLDQEVARLTSGQLSLKEAKAALERRYIIAELYRSGGNITRAAEALGIHRPQLSNLLKRHEIRKQDFEADSPKNPGSSPRRHETA
ncbi:MAG: tetratricopeptide repeat protein [Planctomycetes bacterium]|nr:tetratricopeptide repeat protein [Planctomycetota bacterium]